MIALQVMKKNIILTQTIILTALVAYLFFNITGCKQEQKIADLESRIEELKSEYTPLRFKILDRKNENIRVAIKFYNADGKAIQRATKVMKGNELSFDFYVIPIAERYLTFPIKVFTDKTPPEKGETLTKFYDDKDFPAIYEVQNMEKKLRGGLQAVFQRIKNDDFDADDRYFGNMVHDITDLKNYKTGVVYKIVCRTKGGIEVMED